MGERTRIAVMGLYRSGSTAVAGAIHHLGVDLGAPFYHEYFESAELAALLRGWWDEPRLEATTPQRHRVVRLRQWIRRRDRDGAQWVGAKHPLLSLCGDDIEQAWGPDTRFVWCHRPFRESVESLERLGWWDDCELVQRKLWTELNRFFRNREHLRIDYQDLMSDPRAQIDRLVDYLQLKPGPEELAAAVGHVVPNSKGRVERLRRRNRLLGLIW